MQFPTETRKWTDKDIQRLKELLPEGLSFCTLTGGGRNGFTLQVDGGMSPIEVAELQVTIGGDLRPYMKIDRTRLSAGYCGTTSPVVQLCVIMSDEE